MIALVQRVTEARVDVGEQTIASIGRGILAFTLAADTGKGTRPGFSSAAPPDEGERLFGFFVEILSLKVKAQTGRFGADMKVSLVNDGPVTFWLQSRLK